MALFTFGEGYHHYHHEFQHDYPKRREAMAMGSDQMADLDSFEAPIKGRRINSVKGRGSDGALRSSGIPRY